MYIAQHRITIVEDDNLVLLDGYTAGVDCSELDADIWCVQWDVAKGQGEVEFNSSKPNQTISSISDYQDLIDAAGLLIQTELDKEQAKADLMNSFDYQQKVKVAKIADAAQKFIDSIITDVYPEFEKLTFEEQKKEALAWEADNSSLTPYLDLLAGARGIDRVELINKVIVKVNEFQQVCFYIAGQRQAKTEVAKSATTTAELDAIDLSYSLPQ